MTLITLFFLLQSTISTSHADYASLNHCDASIALNSTCIAKVENIRPTQFSVGMIVVQQKEAKIKAKSKKDYEKYLFSNSVPVVLGNGGQMYMIDKHHLARAVYELGNKDVVVQVVKDLSPLAGDDFWNEMTTEGLYYNRDENDVVQPYTALPYDIQDLADDPFRSLSGEVRDAGGYTALTTPLYLEFLWAHFFHQLDPSYGITLQAIQSDINGTVTKALPIAHSNLASQMPGYSSVPVNNP